ncbi:VPLPA-CTERM sorting domain-containing protein [Pseudooceanicola sp. LIPI14-2-Ac024]|uniref:VPLPA-CTERM sorting domain-containing protein n=1 Tax=Pseudooceanicola sp. LIPI14-2-Ac024 TaxID=3344875 RepID=UPI0035D10350
MKYFGTFSAAALVAGLMGATPASALTTFTASDNFGTDPVEVVIAIDQMGDEVQFTLTIDSSSTGNIGDLRAFYFDFSSFSAAESYYATGAAITDTGTTTSNVGGGGNVNPRGPFDFAVEIGTSGIGSDDYQMVSFLFGVTGGTILESDFFAESVAVRTTSVGAPGSARGGSSKTGGTVPTPPNEPPMVPLPAGGLLLLSALGGAMVMKRRKKA